MDYLIPFKISATIRAMKKTIALIISLNLLLTACGGGGNSVKTGDSEVPLYYKYITAEFSIDAPIDWETVNAFTAEYPGELRVAFRNNVKDSDLMANLTVVREANANSLTNADWAQNKLSDHAATLVDYKLISQEAVVLEIRSGSSNSFINTFEGKNGASEPTLVFKQAYLTMGDQAWTATATYEEGEDPFVVQALETMLKTFTLK